MENEELVQRAYQDWQCAMDLFNNAFEPDDVEYAVFNLEAKRRNYLRLLNKVKKDQSMSLD